MKYLGGGLVGAVIIVAVLVMGGVVELRDLDPRNLQFGQDYTELRASPDCWGEDSGGALAPTDSGDAYDTCVEKHWETWEKARESVYERGFRDGRGDSCDTLRGGYVDPRASARTRDEYVASELREQYQDGYNAGSVMVLMGGGC